jgi:hypothetical protein
MILPDCNELSILGGVIMESHKRKLITDIELSEIIGLSVQTIRKHRWLKSGLPYIRIGRTVRYDIDQVEVLP